MFLEAGVRVFSFGSIWGACFTRVVVLSDLAMFTPGTDFMKKLSIHIKKIFSCKEAKERFQVNQIIVATPEQVGEGEHKLCEHLL